MEDNKELNKIQQTDVDRTRPKTVRSLLRRYYRQIGGKRNIAKSNKWFWQKAVKLGRLRNAQIFAGGYKRRNKPFMGKLYYFQYLAEHRGTLPYWDMFPLAFVFNMYEHHDKVYLTALNLHYLPPKLRAILFANLMKFRTEKRYREKTRLKMQWSMIKNFAAHKLAKACVKSYIFDKKHILSKFIEIPSNDWEMVIPLQISRFQKQSQKQVYADSIRKSR